MDRDGFIKTVNDTFVNVKPIEGLKSRVYDYETHASMFNGKSDLQESAKAPLKDLVIANTVLTALGMIIFMAFFVVGSNWSEGGFLLVLNACIGVFIIFALNLTAFIFDLLMQQDARDITTDMNQYRVNYQALEEFEDCLDAGFKAALEIARNS